MAPCPRQATDIEGGEDVGPSRLTGVEGSFDPKKVCIGEWGKGSALSFGPCASQGVKKPIRDSLRRSVRAYVSMSYEYGTVPDLEMLSRRLQRSADDLFGEGVADLTISAVLVHREREQGQ